MTGAALGQLGAVAMGLVGLIGLWRARRDRTQDDPEADKRLAQRVDMERRMASYLASRDQGGDRGR